MRRSAVLSQPPIHTEHASSHMPDRFEPGKQRYQNSQDSADTASFFLEVVESCHCKLTQSVTDMLETS